MRAKHSFLGMLFVLSVVLCSILAPTSASRSLSQYCDEASKRDPNFSLEFCVSALETIFETKTGLILDDLVAASMNLSMTNATSICSMVDDLLSEKSIGKYTKGALQDCYNLYTDSISTLQEAMDDLNRRDYDKANIDISSIMGAPTTCEEGLEEGNGEPSPMSKENHCFFQITAMALTFISMLSQA